MIGRTKSGTLRLAEDERGLRVEIDVPDTTDGRDLWELVQRGDISGMSFGFSVTRQEWDYNVEPARRTIKEVDLFEVSAVAWPAFDDTEIGKRSLQEARDAAAASRVHEQPSTNRAAVVGARLRMSLALRERELAR